MNIELFIAALNHPKSIRIEYSNQFYECEINCQMLQRDGHFLTNKEILWHFMLHNLLQFFSNFIESNNIMRSQIQERNCSYLSNDIICIIETHY